MKNNPFPKTLSQHHWTPNKCSQQIYIYPLTIPLLSHCYLVGGFNHLEKYEFVNGKDDIPYMKWKKMFETTNQISNYMGYTYHTLW